MNKKEILKLLEADLHAKITEIQQQARDALLEDEDILEEHKERIWKGVRDQVSKIPGTKWNFNRIRVAWEVGEFCDLCLTPSKEMKRIRARMKKTARARDVMIQVWRDKATTIRRRITLYGVDAEVVKMLESFNET